MPWQKNSNNKKTNLPTNNWPLFSLSRVNGTKRRIARRVARGDEVSAQSGSLFGVETASVARGLYSPARGLIED